MSHFEYTNPSNSYTEKVVNLDVFLAFLFGPLFFFAKQAWGWAIVMSVAWSTISFFFFASLFLYNNFLIIASVAAYIILIMFTKPVLRKHYKRLGWTESEVKVQGKELYFGNQIDLK